MDFLLLQDIIVIFGLSVLVLFLCLRLRIPTVVGFLLTGALAGPHGFQLISGIHEVETLAEIGVIFLLFTIGIEFSIKNLMRVSRSVFLGGFLQVGFTILLFYFIAFQRDPVIPESVFIGFLIALSSTAIVLKILQERAQMESPHGQNTLAILIFQDLIIVPMILFIPFLAGQSTGMGSGMLALLIKTIAVVGLMLVAARYIVPGFLHQIARTRSRELFLLSIIVIALAVAWLTYSIGLSLALGAFLAGLIISESEYSEHALGNVVPFLDIFTSFFFVSIGMLFDVNAIIEQPGLVLFFTVLVIMSKTIIGTIAVYAIGFPLSVALMSGLALSQVGEFSFILSKFGLDAGILSQENYPLFIAVSVLTMALTPFIMQASPRITALILKLPLPHRMKAGVNQDTTASKDKLKEHTVIIGYGMNGRNVALAAMKAGIPYRIIEMNPNTVRKEQRDGVPIFFGDAAQRVVLDHANLREALVLVITIADSVTTRQILRMAHSINPHLHIIVRARFVRDVQTFLDLGADEVIPEEFETSIEIFTRVLHKYLIPREEIEQQIQKVREDSYAMLRTTNVPEGQILMEASEMHVDINTIKVCRGSEAIGKGLSFLQLDSKPELRLLTIKKASGGLRNVDNEMTMEENDLLFFLGSIEALEDLYPLFREADDKEGEIP